MKDLAGQELNSTFNKVSELIANELSCFSHAVIYI